MRSEVDSYLADIVDDECNAFCLGPYVCFTVWTVLTASLCLRVIFSHPCHENRQQDVQSGMRSGNATSLCLRHISHLQLQPHAVVSELLQLLCPCLSECNYVCITLYSTWYLSPHFNLQELGFVYTKKNLILEISVGTAMPYVSWKDISN